MGNLAFKPEDFMRKDSTFVPKNKEGKKDGDKDDEESHGNKAYKMVSIQHLAFVVKTDLLLKLLIKTSLR